jgi:hypothetical protein
MLSVGPTCSHLPALLARWANSSAPHTHTRPESGTTACTRIAIGHRFDGFWSWHERNDQSWTPRWNGEKAILNGDRTGQYHHQIWSTRGQVAADGNTGIGPAGTSHSQPHRAVSWPYLLPLTSTTQPCMDSCCRVYGQLLLGSILYGTDANTSPNNKLLPLSIQCTTSEFVLSN